LKTTFIFNILKYVTSLGFLTTFNIFQKPAELAAPIGVQTIENKKTYRQFQFVYAKKTTQVASDWIVAVGCCVCDVDFSMLN